MYILVDEEMAKQQIALRLFKKNDTMAYLLFKMSFCMYSNIKWWDL